VEVTFADPDLDELETTPKPRSRFDAAIIRAFRKVLRIIRDAPDERDIRAMKSLRFEKLKGMKNDKYSLRLNDQWRLIFEIHEGRPKNTIHVLAIEDYH
jgi:proteic killer suppression protein